MTLIPNQRRLFDIPDDVAYFNTATMGPMTTASVEAGQKGLARKLQPWHIQETDFFADTERLRRLSIGQPHSAVVASVESSMQF